MKKIYRSNDNKIIAGIFGGMGEYFEIDPTLLRLGYIAVAILSMGLPALVGYCVAYFIIQPKPTTTQ
jgi:phage shock protein C